MLSQIRPDVVQAKAPYPRYITSRFEVNLREVAPGLFVGGCLALERADEMGVRFAEVIDFYGHGPEALRRRATYRPTMIDGKAFDPAVLDEVCRRVRRALASGRPVLLHCQAGVSRSTSAAYAMVRHLFGRSHQSALRLVRGDPNPKFPLEGTLNSARVWVHQVQPVRRGPKRPH